MGVVIRFLVAMTLAGAAHAQTVIPLITPGSAGSSSFVNSAIAAAAQKGKEDGIAGVMASAPLDVNVRSLGAVGNGVADDTSAFAAAFTAAAAQATASRIVIPAGRYKLSAALSMSLSSAAVTIQGGGSGVSELVWTSDTDGIVVAYASGGWWMRGSYANAAGGGGGTGAALQVRGLSLISDNQRIDGNGVGIALKVNGDTVSGRPSPGTVLDDLLISGASTQQQWAEGARLFQAGYSDIANVKVLFSLVSGSGIGIDLAGTATTNESVDHHLRNIRVTYGATALQVGNGVQGVYVDQLTAVANSYGIVWNNTGSAHEDSLTVSNSHINTALRGIKASNVDTAIVHNTYFLSSNTSGQAYIGVEAVNSAMLNINNNVFRGTFTGTQAGIKVSRDSSVAIQYSEQISDNQIVNMATYGIDFGASFTGGITIAGNTLQYNGTNINPTTLPTAAVLGVNNLSGGASIQNLAVAGVLALGAPPSSSTCPASASGLTSGQFWCNSNVLTRVP